LEFHGEEIPDPLPENEEERAGFRLVLEACLEPFRVILTNGGIRNPDKFLDKIQEAVEDELLGVDAQMMTLVNLKESGVLDPTKVVRSTISNSVSVVSTMLMTETGIYHDKKPDLGATAMG
jgi:chaperonin GroEL